MSEKSKQNTKQSAVERIRKSLQHLKPEELTAKLILGDRSALSQAITLIESSKQEHFSHSAEIIRLCLPHAGKSIRIGITGVPGVGKSTFINAFGSHLTALGKKVAVLAIDPSSPISGGSILGDKTRMEKLASDENAFIRPSPSSLTLGGVARKTRETIILCEAAGYDIIIIETVGVGQSEVAVHGMTDFFLLLMLAGAGDQLQGIKRGIMEMCDAMLITKADGDNASKAHRAKSEYFSALHLFPSRSSGWVPRVDVVSALENSGIDRSWKIVEDFERHMKERGLFDEHRNTQDLHWMHETIREELIGRFYSDKTNARNIREMEEEVRAKAISPFEAAHRLLRK